MSDHAAVPAHLDAQDPIGSGPSDSSLAQAADAPAVLRGSVDADGVARHLTAAFSALGDAVIVATANGTIGDWSPAAEGVLGWSAGEAIGATLATLVDPRPADAHPVHAGSLLDANHWQGAAVVRHRTRGMLTVHLTLTRLASDRAGDSSGVILLRVRPFPDRVEQPLVGTLDGALALQALEHVDELVLITETPAGDASPPRIVFVNRAFERITGYRRDDVLGRAPSLLRGPDSDRGAGERLDDAVRARTHVREELLHYTRHGEPVWLDVDVLPLDPAGGRFTQWMAVERDVTSQRGQEVALRAREERLRLALSAVWDGLWDWHVPTGYCYYAPRWYSMLGFEEHALPPHIDTFLDLLHPQDLPLCEQTLRDHFDGRTETYALEVRLRTADNDWRWVLTRGTVVERDPHGRPVRMVGTHTDIAARKQAELALRTSEERFRTLTMASPLGIFLTDAAGACTFVTPRMRDLWGAPVEALLGRGFRSAAHPDDRDRVQDAWQSAVMGGDDLVMEYRVQRRDGDIRWVCERTAPHRDGAVITGFVGTVEDVTAQKVAAEDRRRLEAQMQHAQKLESLGVLAGGIAHDFNNLLVGILGNVSVARAESDPGSSSEELLGDIEIAARRAAELTMQLLAYAGKGRFNIQPLDVSAAVRETSSLLQSAVNKRAVLTLELAEQLPSIAADATQVRQVVMNLLTNASDALEEQHGEIVLSTGVMHADEAYLAGCLAADGVLPGEFVFIEVTDTGIGMDAETLSRIFDPFFTTKFTGRGLGLAATLGIVRGHRGALHVRTAPGAGTVFRVLFPAADRQGPRSLTPRSVLGTPRNGTILVIDDEEAVRDVARRMLERSGYRVLTASDGDTGLDIFLQREADILAIVLDVTMPRMSGTEVLAALRKRGARVPVVLASGYTEESLAPPADGESAPVFVQKPFATESLLAGLDAALARMLAAPE